jgi:hypothetical protein
MPPYALNSNYQMRLFYPKKLKKTKKPTPKPESTTSSSETARKVNSRKEPQIFS